ncbi:MAG: N-acetylmuramoyl-L-alanine amidase [Sedimentisphaerales bacterium]|nr:N-acetylmuramoyl-L-alanine amidase [Sedimentisphaerales bacterium]MBN2844075.1 N-acetylmuramoyl-L-alanine amidase [Sedimentisphaerales bacterium]
MRKVDMTRKIFLMLITLSLFVLANGCYKPEPEYKPYSTLDNASAADYNFNKPIGKPQADNKVISHSIVGKIVIIDAGHGGKDPGTNGNGVREKDFNLKMAKLIAEKLQAKGCRVIMTRSSDVYIDLDTRAAAADRYKCDLLVSVHADYNKKTHISGLTVLTGSKASAKSKQAAQIVLSSLSKAGVEYRGTRSQELRVCDGHSRPSLLIECGFVSNYDDAAKLKNNWYQNKLATALADGIANYLAR